MNSDIELVEDDFGFIKDETTGTTEVVRRFTMTNKNGMSVQVITFGGAVTSLKVPDKEGKIADVVLGFDDLNGYRSLNGKNPYFGAVIGRVANRIGNATFKIGDQVYHVTANEGKNQFHGGFKGFDKVIWESHVEGSRLTLSYLSKDGEEGFPGEVLAHATYQLTPDNELILEFKATTTKPTPVNLTNHSYFNLAGHTSGSAGLYEHVVSINADKYTPVDSGLIPTGEIKSVGGTIYDLRIPRALSEVIPQVPGGGYDTNMCINSAGGGEGGKRFVARVIHPKSGRVLEMYADQPGVQFYTGNGLPVDNSLPGKGGVCYKKHGAFCLETQDYPDAVNHANFPDSIVNPGSMYSHNVVYQFSVEH